MAAIGLSDAAKLTGRNQSTIHRAMKGGRLSYTVGEGGEGRTVQAQLTPYHRPTEAPPPAPESRTSWRRVVRVLGHTR
jgi:hypothetical protein